MRIKFLVATAVLSISFYSKAQKIDTVFIDANQVSTHVLKPGVNSYLVFFKDGKDSVRTRYQFWTRKIDFIRYNQTDAIQVIQRWEDSDTVIHTVNTICDKRTFESLYQESWSRRGKSIFDFVKKDAWVNGKPLKDLRDSISTAKLAAFEKACDQFTLNWHLDLEVFPLLPYKDNRTFVINFYDPGLAAPKHQTYTVIGTDVLTGYDHQKIECWLLKHGSLPRNQEIFWISKKTKEVLKLEQQYGGKFRYKIKLGYSN